MLTYTDSFRCQVSKLSLYKTTINTNEEQGMIMGACLEADHRIREYEVMVRMQKRMIRDRAVWESYEREFDEATPVPRETTQNK